jgi:cyclic beta-1,2-glucan synthetase
LPIVFMRVEEQTNIEFVKQLIQAHTYWRLKGLAVDLVIWNENFGGYRQSMQNEIMGLVATLPTEKSGGIYVRASDQISNEDRILFQTVARISISGAEGSLSDFINRKIPAKIGMPFIAQLPVQANVDGLSKPLPDLQFNNGLGGFSPDGKEYVITVTDKKPTPAPWVNVLANPSFGTIISESGQCYSWAENAHEYRLTPWNNDPISDTGGEAFYIRDDETGHHWSATPLPRGSKTGYTIRHCFGYSTFEHIEAGIKSKMTVYVDQEAAIKFTVISLENISGLPRKLSVTGYTEWVLGDLRSKSAMFVTTESDTETGALFARNTYNKEFESYAAFFDTDETNKTFTADRAEFIGRNNSLRNPDAMLRTRLSGRKGVGVDPCAAIQVYFDLPDEGTREVVFKLGAGKTYNEAKSLAKKFKGKEKSTGAFEKVKSYWQDTLGKVQVQTPDAGLNVLANGWLAYQVLSSRIWARSGFYQSSGAFGFRDQLQDSLALLLTLPEIARKQILLCASKQFKEGDVMHWWHPPVGRGVRTKCSDDFLWLPFATALYVLSTGDDEILTEQIPFLDGRILNAEEESNYDLPTQSAESGTVYEHCVRAIKHSWHYGEKGLPLIGSGDWNDGMNEVGRYGKGESVWLAFFLFDILKQFGKIAKSQNDTDFAQACESEAIKLQLNIEKNAWDGNWYIRAFFDDGTPLGSSANEECKIDSIAQSWSVLSGASLNGRSKTAINSAYEHLFDPKLNIIKLLSPPFDKTGLEPGYIKGYVPGVRENGGQYTHAAVWLIMAFAKLGDHECVWKMFNSINPINHTTTSQGTALYKDEPYVLAGDVYAQSHPGQGGWSWYTGSAGWMYRLIIENIIGVKLVGEKLSVAPCAPIDWKSFSIAYQYKNTRYKIIILQNQDGNRGISLDGKLQDDMTIPLLDDGQEHQVDIAWSVTELTTVQ